MNRCRLGLPVFVLASALPACSSLEPVEMPAADVQQMIISGEISLEGERVRVVTSDGKTHKYRVTTVDREARLVRGTEAAVPIEDIVAIETREFSIGRTALLAGGSYLFLALLAIAAGPALLL